MTNLEREMKLKQLDDEELEFKNPIIEDEFEFEVVSEDDFIIEKTIEKEAPKSPKKKCGEKTSTKGIKTAKKDTDDATEVSHTDSVTNKDNIKNTNENITNPTENDNVSNINYMEDSEPPIIRMTPTQETVEHKPEEPDSFEQYVQNMQQHTTEEFDYVEDINSTEETLNGEVEGEGRADTIEFTEQERYAHREREFAEANPSNIKTFPQLHISDTIKKIGSLAAVFILFVICFKSYGYYIDKKMTPINQGEVTEVAKNIKEDVSAKTSDVIKPYKEQAEAKRQEATTTPTPTTALATPSNESNIVKLDKIIAKKHEQPTEEETTSRFATLKDLTQYINENTMMLYDILDNTEQQYAAGTISLEEYSRIYTEAKEKLAELSTLLTTNVNIYINEQKENDYETLIENINTVNDTF